MSSSSSNNNNRSRHSSGYDVNPRNNGGSDDVERYRQRNRQSDRRHREGQDDDNNEGHDSHQHSHQHSNQHKRRSPSNNRDRDRAREREERMARLREELKKEDETLAALDQQQTGKDGNNNNGGADQQGARGNSKYSLPQETIIEVRPEELEGLDEEEQMRKLLGIEGFGSTKGQAVEDNQSTAARGGAAKNKARKYRQYMNRKAGFNKPLEKIN